MAQEQTQRDEARKIELLCMWAHDNGAYWRKVRVGVDFEGIRGVQAIDDIDAYERFIAVPNRLLFSYKLAQLSPLSLVFAENPLDAFDTEDVVFTLFLLYEKRKGEASFWHPFLDALPSSIDTTESWERSDTAECQDAGLAYDANFRYTSNLRRFMQAKKILQSYPEIFPEPLTFKEYFWAHQVISTRCFGTYTPYTCLAPIGELLNHNDVDTVYTYGEEDDDLRCYSDISSDEDQDDTLNEARSYTYLNCEEAFRLVSGTVEESTRETVCREARFIDEHRELRISKRAKDLIINVEEEPEGHLYFRTGGRGYARGSQVFMHYGRLSNRALLAYYGFCITPNKYDYALLYVTLASLCQLNPRLSPSEDWEKVLKFKLKAHRPCIELINTMRVFAWNPETDGPTGCFSQTSLDLECRVVTQYIQLAELQLKSYPTTLEEDQQLLEQAQTSRLKHALVYRVSFKGILHKQIAMLQELLSILQSMKQGANYEDSTSHLKPESVVGKGLKAYLSCIEYYHYSSKLAPV
mmetsp:Transcript_9300/g.17804  ORF Transcript_9300/g.17804 Transcript_9300/m.17804 type:complete len:524 (-) Transcript_9300:3397-4968(-)